MGYSVFLRSYHYQLDIKIYPIGTGVGFITESMYYLSSGQDRESDDRSVDCLAQLDRNSDFLGALSPK